MLRTVFLLAFFVSFVSNSFTQSTIYFGYDNSGNRQSRTIILPKSTEETIDSPDQEIDSDHLGEIEVLIYPNPTNGILLVELRNMEESALGFMKIYSIDGKLVFKNASISNINYLNFSDFPSGAYQLIIDVDNKRINRTVIKE